jgi:hypothetical protein
MTKFVIRKSKLNAVLNKVKTENFSEISRVCVNKKMFREVKLSMSMMICFVCKSERF